jgi:hypothetical protein
MVVAGLVVLVWWVGEGRQGRGGEDEMGGEN